MAKHKYIESPEIMESLFNDYVKETKSKPILVQDFVGKDGSEVDRKKERPLTMEGFELFVFRRGLNAELKDYFIDKDKRYSDYAPICSHIKKSIRNDQIEGGMAGIYNPSITQRLNGLKEQTENKNENTNIEIKAEFGIKPE